MQCSIPAFEGLLNGPHDIDNKCIIRLLYRTAEWHGFAKLRIHTSSTLAHLEKLTKEFGLLMQQFRDTTCSRFQTTELLHEAEARRRKQQRVQRKMSSTIGKHTHAPQPANEPAVSSALSSRKPKTLNLSTPKFHALGDYTQTIQMFGSTDSFLTQVVCYSYL